MGNSRNGSYSKTVTTEAGQVELAVSRDRAGSFEPVIVPKFSRQLDGLADNVISLCAKASCDLGEMGRPIPGLHHTGAVP